MTQLSVTTNANLVRQGLENLALEIPQIGRRRVYNTMRKIKAAVSKPGKAINYPVKWDSDRQRRAYFASGGFGRGIPTVRTNEYVSSWQITPLNNGYMLQNQTKGAKYISGGAYGNTQSRIHQGRWVLLRDAAAQEIEKLPDEISEEINMVARRERLK